MAREAERLMAGSGWLPEPLRLAADVGSADEATIEAGEIPNDGATEIGNPDLPAFLTDDADNVSAPTEELDEQQHLDAAE
ncbi:hypothetical protein ACVJBD_000303 [Rhizobium mongolense]